MIVDSQELCIQLARRTANDRHGVVIAACRVVPARRYLHVVQPGALTAPSQTWADQADEPGGLSAESQLPEAGGVSGTGPFPTKIGVNFGELLLSLEVPAAPNRTQPAYGLIPASYPAAPACG